MPEVSLIGTITFVSYPVERLERDFADFDIANSYCDLKFRQTWILYRRENDETGEWCLTCDTWWRWRYAIDGTLQPCPFCD